jgi:peptide/nickel transport system permease protein
MRKQAPFGRARARTRDLSFRPWFAVTVLAIFAVAAILGPILIGYDGSIVLTGSRLLPPGSVLDDGTTAILGTDQVGRDIFGQVLLGARVSLLVGISTLVLAGAMGTIIGMVSGYYGGVVDSVFMRLADIQLAFPSILLAILIAAMLGPSITNIVITLAIARWVTFARVARSATLAVKNREYVQAGRLLGASDLSLLLRYIFPAGFSSLVVVATVEFGLVIIAEASLSFLGLGTTDAAPSWGLIIANGRDYIDSAWWISTMPGIALAIVMVAIGLLGDQLRNRLDPALS